MYQPSDQIRQAASGWTDPAYPYLSCDLFPLFGQHLSGPLKTRLALEFHFFG